MHRAARGRRPRPWAAGNWRSRGLAGLTVTAALALVAATGPSLQAASAPTHAATSHGVFLAAAMDPPALPADGQTSPALYLELLDGTGRATALAVPTVVSIASTDASIATVEPSVTIPAGTSAIQVPVTTTDRVGKATLEVHADGLATTSAPLATTGASGAATGAKLVMSIAPLSFFRGGTGPAWVSVVLETAEGTPFPARQPESVDLVSSDPAAMQLPASVTIPSGAYMATVPVHPGANGGATLAALAPGFAAGTVQTSVVPAGDTPAGLRLAAVPPVVLPGTVPHLVAQAVDSQGRPVPYPCGLLLLASANRSVLDVARSAAPACAERQESVSVDAGPAIGAGTAAIAAAQSGLVPATANISVLGAAPGGLVATVAPTALMYGGAVNGWLVMGAVDAKGLAVDTGSPLTITLSGAAGALPPTATIAQGSSFVTVPLRGLTAGTSPVVTLTAPGLPGVSVTLASSTAGLGGGGRSGTALAPTLRLFGLSIPIAWLALLLGLAAVGLAIVLMAPPRRPSEQGRHGRQGPKTSPDAPRP